MLDLSRVLAGPLCTMVLADLGAEVIKVERPATGDDTRQWGPPWVGEGDDRQSAYFLCANRNKRSVLADLDRDEDRRLVGDLARTADVLIENFRPGTLERRALGYDTLAEDNPGLVSCSITGYDPAGPAALTPGYDFALQAASGWMAVTGESEGTPSKVGVAVVDVLTGQNAAIAILAALRERERSGRGQKITVSLFDSALAGLVNVSQAALATGRPAPRHGNAHPTIVPYEAFEAADRIFVVAVGNDAQWVRFCEAAELPSLATDARFRTNPDRVEHREALSEILSDHFRSAPARYWLERLEGAEVPCAPVRDVTEALDDPAALPRDGWRMRVGEATVETVPPPYRLSRTPPSLARSAPLAGEHDAEVRTHGWNPPPAEPLRSNHERIPT